MADISALVTQEALRIAEQLTVPTRIYFPSSGSADITVTADAAWENTGSAVTRKAIVNGRKIGSAAASITVTGTAANPEQMLHAQYITIPLQAQTISGNVRGQFRCLESATGANATIQIGIRVVSKDGGTVRATLLAVGGTTTTSTTPPEFASSLTNRQLLTSGDVSPLPLSSYTCIDGDRLVIEIGHNNKSTSTSQTHGISFGDNTVDLLTDNTTTTAQDPWIEFDTTLRFSTQVETMVLDDVGQGVTQLMNQGWVKISESLTVVLLAGSDLAKNLADAELLHVQDTVTPALQLVVTPALTETIQISDTVTSGSLIQATGGPEGLRIADSASVTLDPLGTSPIEALRVQDTLTALQVLLANVSESIKCIDIGLGQTQLFGVVHVVDGPPIAVLSLANQLFASPTPSETLFLADAITASRDLTTSLSEAVGLAESLTAIEDHVAAKAETLSVVDTVATTLDPEEASFSESLKIADPVTGSFSITATVSESLVIADTATPTLDPLQTSLSELLRAADIATAIAFISTTLSEALRIADTVAATLDPIEITVGEQLSVVDLPLASQQSLIQTNVPSENLKLSDRVVILSAVISETFRVIDVGQGRTQLIGTFRIADGPVQAQLGSLLSAGPIDTIKIGETLVAERSPFDGFASDTIKIGYTQSEVEYTRDEYLKVQDIANASVAAPTSINTSIASETLLLTDTVSMNRDLAQLAVEAFVVAETITAARGLTASVADALTPTDSIVASRDITFALTEPLLIADSLSGYIDPLRQSVSESINLSDSLAVSLNDQSDLVVGQSPDVISITDVLIVFSDLSVAVSETIRVAEVLDYGDGSVLLPGELTDAITLADSAIPGIELRVGVEQEDLILSESVDATTALVVVIAPEHIRSADGDLLQTSLDLAVEIPSPDLDPIDIFEFTNEAMSSGMFTDETISSPMFGDELLRLL